MKKRTSVSEVRFITTSINNPLLLHSSKKEDRQIANITNDLPELLRINNIFLQKTK